VLVSEFGGTFYTIAKDVKFQLEFNPVHVDQYRLIGYENRVMADEDFDNDKKDAGDIGAGHTVTALYEIIPMGNKKLKDKTLKYQTPQLTEEALNSNDLVNLKLRYKEPEGSASELVVQTLKNTPLRLNKTTDNFRFSAAVTEFGMLLRDSEFKGTSSWDSARELALNAKGDDAEGYRAEMIRLIEAAQLLSNEAYNEE
ncbi:MAG: YfbK domain-containing protein, partial [Bacteroidota bacterium]